MKKVFQKILISFNLALILLLLLVSGAMLFFSSSTQPDILGHSVFLLKEETASSSQQSVLLIVENRATDIKAGDKISYYTKDLYHNKTQFSDTIVSITDNIATFENSNNKVNITSDLYIGKISSENVFWGTVLSSIVDSNHTTLIYVALIGGFLLISLIIILGFVILEKKKNLVTPAVDTTIEVTTEDEVRFSEEDESQTDDIQTVYEEEILHRVEHNGLDPLVRVEHKDRVVLPNALSQPHLSSDKPLFDSHKTNQEPPKNIGTTRKYPTFEERKEINPIETETDLFNLYQVIEQTNELNIDYSEVADEIHIDTEHLHEPLAYSETMHYVVPAEDDEADNEHYSPQFDSILSVDSIIDDIIRKVEEEFNQNNQ